MPIPMRTKRLGARCTRSTPIAAMIPGITKTFLNQ